MRETPHPEPNNNKKTKSILGGNIDDGDKKDKNVKTSSISIIKDIRDQAHIKQGQDVIKQEHSENNNNRNLLGRTNEKLSKRIGR